MKNKRAIPVGTGYTVRDENVPLWGNRVSDQKLDKTFTSSTYDKTKTVPTGYTGKKAKPLDKSKKKGSPRSYEDASRKSVIGKGVG